MSTRQGALPKIAPAVYARARLQTWLTFHADVPLRYVCAPAGSGKTTVAVMYARSRANRVAFVGLQTDTTTDALYALIAAACGCEPTDDYDALLQRLADLERIEIIIDDVDRATRQVRVQLEKLYRDAGASVSFVYLLRSRESLDVAGGQACGLVEMCDPEGFNFDIHEIALFAQALGLDEDVTSIARLAQETHGWATAVAGVCRAAASQSAHLSDAWPHWHRTARRAVDDLVVDALRHVPRDVAAAFDAVIAGRQSADQRTLSEFSRYGLFVAERDGSLRLNPMLRRECPVTEMPLERRVPGPAAVDMFGRFDFLIDGQPVPWQRRRDRQIVQYLAMQPDGRATRAELIACFWPQADRQLAAQSLRTACCTIRRALAARVGHANVSRYFIAERVVELKLDAVQCTVGRFVTHIERGDYAFAAGEAQTAYAHYAAAQRLYRAPFLAGEAPVDWTGPYLARLTVMHGRCVTRLEALLAVVRDSAARLYPLSGAEPIPSA